MKKARKIKYSETIDAIICIATIMCISLVISLIMGSEYNPGTALGAFAILEVFKK